MGQPTSQNIKHNQTNSLLYYTTTVIIMRVIALLLLVALLATVVLCARPAAPSDAVDALGRRHHHPWRRHHHGRHHRHPHHPHHPRHRRHPHHRRHPRPHPRKPTVEKKPVEEAMNEKFDLACTYRCTAYHACLAKGAWNGATNGCGRPSGCNCNKFSF